MSKKEAAGTVWAQFRNRRRETRKALDSAIDGPETKSTRPRRKGFPPGRGMIAAPD
jgi:hypothetical protein